MSAINDIKNTVTDWKQLIISFGIESQYLDGKHHPCPLCGGTDRFRYDNKHGVGNYFCNGCGAGNGFDLIMGYNNWNIKEAIKELSSHLGIARVPETSEQTRLRLYKAEKEKYMKACQWHYLSMSSCGNLTEREKYYCEKAIGIMNAFRSKYPDYMLRCGI